MTGESDGEGVYVRNWWDEYWELDDEAAQSRTMKVLASLPNLVPTVDGASTADLNLDCVLDALSAPVPAAEGEESVGEVFRTIDRFAARAEHVYHNCGHLLTDFMEALDEVGSPVSVERQETITTVVASMMYLLASIRRAARMGRGLEGFS